MKYLVEYPIAGTIALEIEASSEKEAENLAFFAEVDSKGDLRWARHETVTLSHECIYPKVTRI